MTSRVITLVAVFLLAAFSGYLGWRWLHPEARACAQSIALCHPSDTAKATASCRELLDDVRARLGASNERLAARCMMDSMSCNESLSCLSHADRRAHELQR